MPKANKPYQLRQKGDDVYELQIYGDIGESWWGESVSATEVIEQLKDIEASEIIVCINSYGGSVSDGTAIVNALQRHPAKITTRNEGVAVSIAAYIFMAGDDRQAHENTLYMIHAPWSGAAGNSKEFREMADLLDKFAEAQINTFVSRTGMEEEEIRSLLTDGKDHWYTAEEAMESGFATAVIEQEAIVDESFMASSFSQQIPTAFIQKFAPSGAHRITQCDNSSAHAEPTKPTEEHSIMPKEVKASADETEQTVDVNAVKQEATQAERTRANDIKKAVNAAGLEDSFAQKLINDGTEIDQARTLVLEKLAEKTPQIDNHSPATVVETGQEKFRQDVIDGVLARAGVKGVTKNQFSRQGFRDLARACVEQSGTRTGSMSSDQILQAAITNSTGDFANIFENIMHKTLLDKFRLAPHVWRNFCGTGDLSDFRDHNRYNPSSFGDLKGLQENGEFKQVAMGDAEKQTIKASSKGVIFNLSYEMLKNDDMGAFLSIARGLGQAAARSLENDVFALLSANPAMSDGDALFHANHGNLPTAAAISMASLDAARVAMRKQKDPGGNEFLDINPSILLCGVEKGGLARQTIASETDPSQNNSKKPNIVRDMATVVDTPRISGNEWYLFSDPSDIPAIEVGFLDGVQEPEIVTEESFVSRGINYRVAFDYGVAAIEYRSALKNAGA